MQDWLQSTCRSPYNYVYQLSKDEASLGSRKMKKKKEKLQRLHQALANNEQVNRLYAKLFMTSLRVMAKLM